MRFTTREEGVKTVLVGENTHPAMPYYVVIEFPIFKNVETSEPVPARVVIPPDTTLDLLTVQPRRGARSIRWQVKYDLGRGDPEADPDEYHSYLLPFAHGTKHSLDQGYFGRATHKKMRALDFNMPEGTPIHAARGGVVTGVKEDSNIGGAGPEFAQHGNYVEILHADGTWANYAHLQQNGAKVRVGQRVKAGHLGLISEI